MAEHNLPPQQDNPNHDTQLNQSTRANQPMRDDDTEQNTRHQTKKLRSTPPAPSGAHVQPVAGQSRQPPPGYQPRPRRAAKQPKDSALYLPLWSIVAMLIGVLVVSAGLVGAVYLFRNGGNFLAEPDPIILIVTAQPQSTENNTFSSAGVASTQIISGQDAPTNLDLSGPTLAPIQLSATPAPIRVGINVVVDGVDLDLLNVRNSPSLTESSVLFRADEDELFTVVEGPQQSNGFTWWRIQDPNDINRAGWAVSNFLAVEGTQRP